MPFTKTVRPHLTLTRSLFTLLLVFLPVVLVPKVEAQVLRPVKKQTGVVNAGDPATAINPDVLALRTSSDLIIENLGLTGKGSITFELRNRGEVPINPPTPPITTTDGSTITEGVPVAKQIPVNIYLNDLIHARLLVDRLGGKESKTFTQRITQNDKRPWCAQEASLKTVIDSANVIVELTDTNNVNRVIAVRPCADLAIASIEKKFNDLSGTEYSARITLVNKGNAPADSFDYTVYTVISGQGHSAMGTAGPLAPGQTMELNSRSASANDRMLVRVTLDAMYPGKVNFIEEPDEKNNTVERTLNAGPLALPAPR